MAKIFSMKHRTDLDSLRKKSSAHAALMHALKAIPGGEREVTDIADYILAGLWDKGFKVVRRDNKEAG